MKKRIFIIHRWSGLPSTDWYSWLKEELESKDFEVFVPPTPHPHTPTIKDSVDTLAGAVGEPDSNTYFVGHSIGCQTVLRYLESIDTKVGGAVFVAPWFNLMGLEDEEVEKIAEPWLKTPIDFNKVKTNIQKLVAIFSSNDPYVPKEDIDFFKDRLNAETTVEQSAGHFTGDDGFKQLPQALTAILKITS